MTQFDINTKFDPGSCGAYKTGATKPPWASRSMNFTGAFEEARVRVWLSVCLAGKQPPALCGAAAAGTLREGAALAPRSSPRAGSRCRSGRLLEANLLLHAHRGLCGVCSENRNRVCSKSPLLQHP